MELLEQAIQQHGIIREGGVLKVGTFLNHQCDVSLFNAMGAEWAKIFADVPVTKILTIESSGIGIACIAALHFNNVPVVFAKKSASINLDGDQYSACVHSYTHNNDNTVIVSKSLLSPSDHVLILDDFLANGCALEGLLQICAEAQVHVEGIGIAIEKSFQAGGQKLREKGLRLESLARIESMDSTTQTITFIHS